MKTRIKVVETTFSDNSKTVVYIPQSKKTYDGFWNMGSSWKFLLPVFGQIFLIMHILFLIEDSFYRRFDVSDLDKIIESELEDEIAREVSYNYYAFLNLEDAKNFLRIETQKYKNSLVIEPEKVEKKNTYYIEYRKS